MPATLIASPSLCAAVPAPQPTGADRIVASVAAEFGLDRGHNLDYKELTCDLFELACEEFERAASVAPSPIERAALWCAATAYCANRGAR